MSPRFLVTRLQVARKQHQCWECTRLIEPGTLYRVDLGPHTRGEGGGP